MGIVLDIASSHYSHASIAMAKGNRIFMWGLCCGQKVNVPTLTILKSLHDGFAFYVYPRVMHCPLILENETNLIDSLKEAFDDPVCTFGDQQHVC